MKYDAVRILMELEKKLGTFQRHGAELEVAVRNDETESDWFAKDYDAYDDVLNTAEDYQTKLEFIIKYEGELVKKEEKEEEVGFNLTKEK